ncbi:nucleotidyl transferase AbiEii/AbiGii toxin family protein [Pseudoflavitalea sp. X16]|uniref:nucleotidyl transferase AbiEii/AbiGii toxin family protein n=1 Tax=Paraflavitalea devenefica TaxID=2716334 RepID=UPI00141F7814|nr:nucleotidyl transferase AbiEii/AbiGii toxin family protein [Paraflavitalea devenefica]NII28160.1 nucleotidyl transferase AbiEii/AbiGii toxin family protein [Paraflavitalea devenefica]
MNVLPDKSIIEEVASIIGISPSFVEKDWYVTQVIKIAGGISFQDFQIIFTGGTALSKAHRLLQRFSEDTDFRVVAPGLNTLSQSKQRALLSAFKSNIISSFKTVFQLEDEKVYAGNGNRFIAIEIEYSSYFPPENALRPHILIEFTVMNLELPALQLPVSSLVNELAKKSPEVAKIDCTDPAENACDKLSAIAWRIPNRVRGSENDDPTVVRHIHDLAIMSDLAVKHPLFKTLVIQTVKNDDQRSVRTAGMTIVQKLNLMMEILEGEKEYVQEYDRFVRGMSYAPDHNLLSYHQAVEKLRILVNAILS